MHAVGDGAPWIVGQIEDLFGEKGSYLLDFYDVCEYLGVAAKSIVPKGRGPPPCKSGWRRKRTR